MPDHHPYGNMLCRPSGQAVSGQRVGWGWPALAAKPHYFEDAKSLCGKWMFTGEVDAPLDPGRASDCSPCRKALEKLNLRRTGERIESVKRSQAISEAP